MPHFRTYNFRFSAESLIFPNERVVPFIPEIQNEGILLLNNPRFHKICFKVSWGFMEKRQTRTIKLVHALRSTSDLLLFRDFDLDALRMGNQNSQAQAKFGSCATVGTTNAGLKAQGNIQALAYFKRLSTTIFQRLRRKATIQLSPRR